MRKSDLGRYAIVPEWLLQAGVSGNAIKVFVVLALHANRDTDGSWPSRRKVAADCSVSVDSVDRGVKELVEMGAIAVAPDFGPDEKDRTSNTYVVFYAPPGSRTDAATSSRIDAARASRKAAAVTRTSGN